MLLMPFRLIVDNDNILFLMVLVTCFRINI
jgi:hypothetical protein